MPSLANIESSAEAQNLIAQCAMWCRMTGRTPQRTWYSNAKQLIVESIALGREFKDLSGWHRRIIAGLEDYHA